MSQRQSGGLQLDSAAMQRELTIHVAVHYLLVDDTGERLCLFWLTTANLAKLFQELTDAAQSSCDSLCQSWVEIVLASTLRTNLCWAPITNFSSGMNCACRSSTAPILVQLIVQYPRSKLTFASPVPRTSAALSCLQNTAATHFAHYTNCSLRDVCVRRTASSFESTC